MSRPARPSTLQDPSGDPIVPLQESPKGEILWRRVTDPLMDLDIYA
jgi:hypothetical protein